LTTFPSTRKRVNLQQSIYDEQAFSQDLKSGHPKCATGPAQMNNLKGNIRKIE